MVADDIQAWRMGVYVREAIVSAFNKSVQYSSEPMTIAQRKAAQRTSRDDADDFRAFLARYKRPPVKKVVKDNDD